jgi:hypothetical protein
MLPRWTFKTMVNANIILYYFIFQTSRSKKCDISRVIAAMGLIAKAIVLSLGRTSASPFLG